MNIAKKKLSKLLIQVQECIKKIVYHDQGGFNPEMQAWFYIHNPPHKHTKR